MNVVKDVFIDLSVSSLLKIINELLIIINEIL